MHPLEPPTPRRRPASRRRLAALCLVVLVGAAAGAQEISVSPDVTLDLPAGPVVANDEDVVVDDLMGGVSLAALGGLPAESALSAYELLANGDQLLCLETTVELPGAVVAQPGDVVRRAAGTFSLAFDASAEGVPPGAVCDAVAEDGAGRLWLSFDVSVSLPGGVLADDEDLVRRDAASSFSLAFDGSAAGVPGALDLDGASRVADGTLVLSFDGAGLIGGVAFEDEDAVAYDPMAATWSPAYDASLQDPAWEAADTDAVALPEPGPVPAMVAGAALLVALSRGSARRRTAASRA